MSLSGKSNFQDRRTVAREARQERQTWSEGKRPWQLPLIIGIAVVIVAAVVIAVVVFGYGSGR
ncbi:MAG: hypothetical protein ABIR17_03915 [Pseudolysinimonas sp.]|uniref:hypothetical protein n=1 Tax=Pseudolysinimonas sp. TaxID=2680009 RepID=UPI0032653D18